MNPIRGHILNSDSIFKLNPIPLPLIPNHMQFLFYLYQIKESPVPEEILEHARYVKENRIDNFKHNPRDIKNFTVLAQAEQLLGDIGEANRWLELAENELEAQVNEEPFMYNEKLTLYALIKEQKASLLLWKKDYDQAKVIIDELLDLEYEGSAVIIILKVILLLHMIKESEMDADQIVKNYSLIVKDVQTLSLHSQETHIVSEVLELIKNRMDEWQKEQDFLQSELQQRICQDQEGSTPPELKSVLMRLDRAAGFKDDFIKMPTNLNWFSDALRRALVGKKIIVNSSTNNFLLNICLISRIMRLTGYDNDSNLTEGVFTPSTKITVFPGEKWYARSSESIKYAFSCQGIWEKCLSQLVSDHFIFESSIWWLQKNLKSQNTTCLNQIDNVLKQSYDEEISNLFTTTLIHQNSLKRLGDWHKDKEIVRWQSMVFPHRIDLIRDYLNQVAKSHCGIVVTRKKAGIDKNIHVISAVVNPKKEGEEQGVEYIRCCNLKTMQLELTTPSFEVFVRYVFVKLSKQKGPLTIQLYSLPNIEPPAIIQEREWVKRIMDDKTIKNKKSIYQSVEKLGDENLHNAWMMENCERIEKMTHIILNGLYPFLEGKTA